MPIRTIKPRGFSGTTKTEESDREKRNRRLARRAAAEGVVLLKNDLKALPLAKGSKLALFGAGASRTVKGGTGSGDVNERNSVSIFQGLMDAGFQVTTTSWISEYEETYQRAREVWKHSVLKRSEPSDSFSFFSAYTAEPFRLPVGGPMVQTDADAAVYVLSRRSGEGADCRNVPGDYFLSEGEEEHLTDLCRMYHTVIVILNTGIPVDVSFLEKHEKIRALLTVSQPGMEGGRAVADILSGKAVPSGKLTDTWALRYEDYPSSATFSKNDGNTRKEKYEEGIYVGYRYFDTFSVPVRYGFGYGLSYTEFRISTKKIAFSQGADGNPNIAVTVEVKNAGDTYCGREVVQVYASCPVGRQEKEFRRLVSFEKTRLLPPGETQRMTIVFPAGRLASYDESEPGWVLEPGRYGVWVGNSLSGSELEACLSLNERVVLEKTRNLCAPREQLREITPQKEQSEKRYRQWSSRTDKPILPFPETFRVCTAAYDEPETTSVDEAARLAERLTPDQLVQLATGVPQTGQGNNLGSAGFSVPGSAGETSHCAENMGIASIVLADGPAGLRLRENYTVSNGIVLPAPFEAALEHGFFCPETEKHSGVTYYQYCTAIPVGTLLAQSWDTELLRQVGGMIGEEMQEFGVTLWLAPGMNIHRNPLCGRNFEYYSEDPLLSGLMAAAIAQGTQSRSGCGVTIKHFACNNQEEDRMDSESVVSERALREIYLKGFEIAVKEAQPAAIMTSYNRINGVHSANNRDLCTMAARCEWGFQGIFMTDWTTTEHGDDCTASGCIRAGNDLIMPGSGSDHENLREELADGTLPLPLLKSCVIRLVRTILRLGRYEEGSE